MHVSNCIHQLTSLHVDKKTKVTEEVGSDNGLMADLSSLRKSVQ